MQLQRCPKISPDTGIRTILPKETLERVIPLFPRAGMCDLEDITGVDNIGVPVYSVSRPGASKGAVNNYNGKGPTPEQAMASAVMEAMERYSAEQQDCDQIIYGTVREAADAVSILDPKEMILSQRVLNYIDDAVLGWYKGYDLFRGENVWVPANAVFHPYFPDGDVQIFRYHTNGIAAGNTMEEAILHALLELAERDAWSMFEFQELPAPDVIADDGPCRELIEKFIDGGVEIHLKDITNDLGIPTIGAAADDVRTKNPELLTIGVGAHLNPEIAAIRAITEAAQSRTTHKHGVKTNAQLQKKNNELGYERIKKANRIWFEDSVNNVRLPDMRRMDTDYVLDDIETVMGRLVECGFDRAVAVDLTRQEIGVPVVRMIVPGLEVYTMDPEREGARLHGTW